MPRTPTMQRFLTAQWRYLAMLNFKIDPAILKPYLPSGCELDTYQDEHFVSMVGFRFLDTRLRGWAIPFHRNFDEVNLRFYVRHLATDGWRRGVVFIKEIVPLWAVAQVANWVYNENYVVLPMRSQIALPQEQSKHVGQVAYEWRIGKKACVLQTEFAGKPLSLQPNSHEEFIAEHYWGYVRQRNRSSLQYKVEHPPWRIWQATKTRFECDVVALYGSQFQEALNNPPRSAFVADGSEVVVYRCERIPALFRDDAVTPVFSHSPNCED